MREIQPVADFERRLPRAGKIKLGVKTAKAMRALKEFRFVSPYRDVLEVLARIYGGETKPYHDQKANPPDQFELISNANEIDVYLLPDGISTSYELWTGGGIQRRCDGNMVEVPVKVGQNDYEMQPHPCLCKIEGSRQCDVKTRMNVILPQVAVRGAWLLETKSWNATQELPGMHDLISALGARGLAQAKLGIDQRTKQTITGKRNFVVPTLSIVQTALEIQQGMASVGAIGAGMNPVPAMNPAVAALGAGVAQAPPEDDIADAEVIDDELVGLEGELRKAAEFFGLDSERFLVAMRRGETEINAERREAWRVALQKMSANVIAPIGFTDRGTIQWRT